MLNNTIVMSGGDLAWFAFTAGLTGGSVAFILLYLFEKLAELYSDWKDRNPGEIEDASDDEPEPWLSTPPNIVKIAKDIADAESIRTNEREEEGN